MSKRTDIHRPGAIIPANYRWVKCYSLGATLDGYPVPSMGIDCTNPYTTKDGTVVTPTHACPDGYGCCTTRAHAYAKDNGKTVYGNPGKCGVCGACFVYGTLFIHEPTGDFLHMGHDCADKYGAMYDMSAWELENNRTRAALATQIAKAKNEKERTSFLDKYPGLETDLETDHYIVADIKARFVQFRSLSEKQVALVQKIAAEKRNPAPKVEEINTPAPTGKTRFRGKVVSCKSQDGQWGVETKITVKVQTDAGVWLAWGTLPAALAEEVWTKNLPGQFTGDKIKGQMVEITATLKPGRDAHFALMARPSGCLVDENSPPMVPVTVKKPRTKTATV